MKDIFNISKLIIKKKLKVLSDDEKSRLKSFRKEYPFSKSIDYGKIVQKISDYSLINKEAAWKAILEKSGNKENIPSVIPLNRSWYKYAAAASLILLVAVSYLFL